MAASQPQSLLEPIQLKKWIDNGYRTEKGERVVILDVVPTKADKDTWFAGDAMKLKEQAIRKYGEHSPQQVLIEELARDGMLGHIPGARLVISHAGSVVQDRNDGPMEAEHEIGTGSAIDKLLQQHGIQKNDVIVLVSSQQNPWTGCASRLWWTMYYWGFPTENILTLDGGTRAYAEAGFSLKKGTEQSTVTPSNISVADNRTRRIDSRVSLSEMLALVDSGKTTTGEVVLLDTRQPPVDYYLKDELTVDGKSGSDGVPDIFQVPGFLYDTKRAFYTRQSDNKVFTLSEMLFNPVSSNDEAARAPFSAAANPTIKMPNPYLATNQALFPGKSLMLPLSSKGSSFEGIIKGALLVKDSNYNLSVQELVKEGNRFKNIEDLRTLFAKAGIDGSKPIVLYCNTGTMATFYFYILHEVCKFNNVRVYDGSWLEWGALTAYEPVDTTYVRKAPYLLYPAFPILGPSIHVFSGANNYFEWNGTGFVDTFSKAALTKAQIKPGGALKGNARWDTVHRSEHVVFRPSKKVNDPKRYQTYNSDNDWPDIDTVPDYIGNNKILEEDRSYGMIRLEVPQTTEMNREANKAKAAGMTAPEGGGNL
ncbi:sulfurtransferase [Geobacter sp. OR-1]|uniref:sulfurtransferase n=1 Tax=Geobacter sp. OR-1 TaxID=1266765 RepID=UPI001364B118|nr:rhodanese-like domain-containing protein [Geobacter sp. OR-1]